MKRLIFIIVIAAFMAVPTFADIYSVGSTSVVDYVNVSPSEVVNIGGTHTGGVYAGIYNLVVDGVSMDSFCIDLEDNSNTDPQVYNVLDLEDPVGAAKALAISELLYENWWDKNITDSIEAAALQVAVWEVIADGASIDLDTGNFYVTGGTNEAAIVAQANIYLASINGSGDYTDLFVGLTHPLVEGETPKYQDYVVRVPVPGAVLLGLLGLSAAGIKLRKFA